MSYPWVLKFRNKKVLSISTSGLYIGLPFHKGLEITLNFSKAFVGIYTCFCWSRKCDHAGVRFDFNTGLVDFYINLYDGRHWNEEAGRWNTEEDYERSEE